MRTRSGRILGLQRLLAGDRISLAQLINHEKEKNNGKRI